MSARVTDTATPWAMEVRRVHRRRPLGRRQLGSRAGAARRVDRPRLRRSRPVVAKPSAVGGRDRKAGGSWCVTDISSGVTALVLNRPQRLVAAPKAPSRGLLPLLAVRHGLDWPAHLDLTGMASFAVLLAAPNRLTVWEFDGSRLTNDAVPPGTHMLTAGAAEQGRVDRHLPRFLAADSAEQWRALVTASEVEDHPASLVVRHEEAGSTFATVFAQVIEAEAGRVALTYSRTPAVTASWVESRWTSGRAALAPSQPPAGPAAGPSTAA